MSLKAFHLVFITLTTLLAIAFGAWAVKHYFTGEASGLELGLGIFSLTLAPTLIVYGRYFLKKLKNVSYL